MIRRLTSLGLFVLAVAACAPAAEGVDVAAEEQRIRERSSEFLAASQRGDADAFAAMFAPEGRFMAPHAEVAQDSDAIRTAWTEMAATPGFSLSFEPTEIVVASNGEMAFEVGTYEFSFDGPDGPIEDNGKYLTAWTKVDGEWKVAADIFNTNMPAPMP